MYDRSMLSKLGLWGVECIKQMFDATCTIKKEDALFSMIEASSFSRTKIDSMTETHGLLRNCRPVQRFDTHIINFTTASADRCPSIADDTMPPA
jgi:hypothetical protein